MCGVCVSINPRGSPGCRQHWTTLLRLHQQQSSSPRSFIPALFPRNSDRSHGDMDSDTNKKESVEGSKAFVTLVYGQHVCSPGGCLPPGGKKGGKHEETE